MILLVAVAVPVGILAAALRINTFNK